jgi:hypothetical protein
MDERIEAFLKDVLRLEGENSSIVDEGVRRLLAKYESNFANAESDERMKESALEIRFRFRRIWLGRRQRDFWGILDQSAQQATCRHRPG